MATCARGSDVQPALAERTRVCSYDRAGTGGSVPASAPRTTTQAVEDLHALVEAAELPGPYVIVGFSFGGLITQQYASTFPDEVAGLVLVESLHPEEIPIFEEHLTRRQIEEDRASALGNPEGMDPFASVAEIAEAGPLPAVPLVVVSAGIASGWPPGYDASCSTGCATSCSRTWPGRSPTGAASSPSTAATRCPARNPTSSCEAVTSVLDAAGTD